MRKIVVRLPDLVWAWVTKRAGKARLAPDEVIRQCVVEAKLREALNKKAS